VVLMSIFKIFVMVSIFSLASWPFVYLFMRNVYSGPLLIFNRVVGFFIVNIYELLLYPRYYLFHIFTHIFSHFIGCLFTLD
jgi:hypothetical protein